MISYGKKSNNLQMIIAMILLGSLWGFSEVVLGKFLRSTALPFKGSFLMGVSVGILAIAIAIYKKPLILLGITFITLLCKVIAVPLLNWEIYYNSLFAVSVIGIVMTVIAAYMAKQKKQALKHNIVLGASGGFFASMIFYFAGIKLAPCKYLLSFAGLAGFGRWLLFEALLWTAFCAIFLPLGYAIGNSYLEMKILHDIEAKHPFAYYSVSAFVALAFIAACAFVNFPLA